MTLDAVFTDLDGTLLEPDGALRPEARRAVRDLAASGVAVFLVTSKTTAEIELVLAAVGVACHAGFENGAGIRHADGTVELSPAALPVATLRAVCGDLRRRTGVSLRTLEELDDAELARATGLSGRALTAARRRTATLPMLVASGDDGALLAALPSDPRVRLLRGNRFLHLQGRHDKADVVPRLLALGGLDRSEAVACGDAPNDAGLLASVRTPVIVPGADGPHPELVRLFPGAIVAPHPHGRGWAAALSALVAPGRQGVGAHG
ncbi:MAG: HAD-IIB family hydrolase [Acidobacteriota bacterium]